MSVYNITITAATRITTAINCVFIECQKEIFCCLCSVFIMLSPSVIIFTLYHNSAFFTIFNNFFVHFRLFSCIFITYVCLSDKFECRVLFRICQNPDMAVRQMLIVYLQRIFHLNRNLFLFLLHIHTVGINSHQQTAVRCIVVCNILFIFSKII